MKSKEQRFITRLKLQDHRLIKDVYPSAVQIKIKYTITHRSIFGINSKEGERTYKPNEECVFEIDCPNRECTKEYFDLKSEVRDLIESNLSEDVGVMRCQGKEADDHLEQSCDTTLDYKITIEYNH